MKELYTMLENGDPFLLFIFVGDLECSVKTTIFADDYSVVFGDKTIIRTPDGYECKLCLDKFAHHEDDGTWVATDGNNDIIISKLAEDD